MSAAQRHLVRCVIAEELSVAASRLRDDSDLVEIGAKTLTMINLKLRLERDFGIRMSDREQQFCQTVGTICDLIENKLEARQ
jgi:acyl carrier protein